MTTQNAFTDRGPARILLVEDDLDQAYLLRFLLEATGEYRVTLVQDGTSGVEMARKGGWKIVITDLNLPGAHGSSVVEASRKAHPRTPVLATTGYTGPEYAEAALERGADAVLNKPLDRDDLLRKVARLVAGVELASSETLSAGGKEGSPASPEGTAGNTLAPSAGPPVPLRVLAVGLRPAEIELGCGGALLGHRARGDQIVLLILSRTSDPVLPPHDLRERARNAARRIGARFFVGHSDPQHADTFEAQARGFLEAALRELDPDVLYVPTSHRRDRAGATLGVLVEELAASVPRVLAFDPGDATPHFAPATFIPLGSALDEKAALLELFALSPTSPAHPARMTGTARAWAEAAGGEPAEAFEALRNGIESFMVRPDSNPPEAEPPSPGTTPA